MTNKEIELTLSIEDATLLRRAIDAYGADLGSKWGRARQPSTRERLLNESTVLHGLGRSISLAIDGE